MTPRSTNISVVITTYNRPEKLKRCLQAIRDQELLPAEIIVVNDGSTEDYTSVQSWASEVTWIHQENAGVSEARNHGVRHVSAPYTSLCDDDDYFLPNHISTLESAIEGARQPSILHTHRFDLVDTQLKPSEFLRRSPQDTWQEHYLRASMVICATCMPTAALLEFPFPNGVKYAEDHEQRLLAMSRYDVLPIYKHTCVVDRTDETATNRSVFEISGIYRDRFKSIFSHPLIGPHIRKTRQHQAIFRWTSLELTELRNQSSPDFWKAWIQATRQLRTLREAKTWCLHALWKLSS